MVMFNQRIQVVSLVIANCYHLNSAQFFLNFFQRYYGYFFILKYKVRTKFDPLKKLCYKNILKKTYFYLFRLRTVLTTLES